MNTAILHSAKSRTSLWSAEHLTREQIVEAAELKRKNTFHAEEQLAVSDRSELSDYARSGYGRGHLSPSGDMPTRKAQYQSFSLANMIPQNSNNNQHIWKEIELSTRALAKESGDIYVVTGPMYEGSKLIQLHGRVLVPTGVYKAIYNGATHQAGAYIVRNEPGMNYQTVSIAELEQRIGIDVFPTLSSETKHHKAFLAAPKSPDLGE